MVSYIYLEKKGSVVISKWAICLDDIFNPCYWCPVVHFVRWIPSMRAYWMAKWLAEFQVFSTTLINFQEKPIIKYELSVCGRSLNALKGHSMQKFVGSFFWEFFRGVNSFNGEIVQMVNELMKNIPTNLNKHTKVNTNERPNTNLLHNQHHHQQQQQSASQNWQWNQKDQHQIKCIYWIAFVTMVTMAEHLMAPETMTNKEFLHN